ncbi:uncharacterized protein LOC123015446 [Tribolium madens]|uniref:uncharacterized protein LOC123015446 n=1 Tax=Tribolium madens TaxID=41895 RepID=UPI001CF729D8|nr:uncharacterized protein LOC123015446 [Tribolium madens]
MQEKIDNYSKGQHCVVKIESDAKDLEPRAVFLLDQIYNYSLKKPRWSEVTVRHCIAWRYISSKGYEFAKKSQFLKAPSRRTLDRYMGNSQGDPGLTNLIKNRITAEDDMAIKEKMEYSRTEDTFYGIANTENE